MLEGEELARATEARLHLVDAEERPVATTQFLRSAEVAGRRQVDALPLHGLDEEESHVLGAETALERVEVAERHLLESCEQRSEPLRHLAVAVRGERAEREPVEALLRGEDTASSGGRAAELQRRLDGLGAGAREEHALEAGGRTAEELLREERRERRSAELNRAGQVELERLDERGADARVVASDVEHPEAAEHVEVLLAAGIPQVGALGARPLAVEADRLEDARELRVDRASPQVDVGAIPRREQLGEAEAGHALTLGVVPRPRWRLGGRDRQQSGRSRRCLFAPSTQGGHDARRPRPVADCGVLHR